MRMRQAYALDPSAWIKTGTALSSLRYEVHSLIDAPAT